MSQKEAIIKALLQGPKTREELRKALEKKRVGDFSKDLSYLINEKIVIESPGQKKKARGLGRPKKGEKKHKPGSAPATLSISQDLTTYRKIWGNFQDLREDMRKPCSAVETLVKAYENAYGSRGGFWLEEDFRKGLSISPTFFKWHIETDPSIWAQRVWNSTYASISIKGLIRQALIVDYLQGELTEEGEKYYITFMEEVLKQAPERKLQGVILVLCGYELLVSREENARTLRKFRACLEKLISNGDREKAKDEFKKLTAQHPQQAGFLAVLLSK